MDRVCSCCKETKPIGLYGRNARRSDGIALVCKACNRIKSLLQYANNKEKYIAWNKEWQKNNREKSREIKKRYVERHKARLNKYYRDRYAADPARHNAIVKRWAEANPENRQVRNHRRRMKIKNNGRCDLTAQEWQSRLQEFNFHCAYCHLPFDNLEIEHMIPIAKGGEHTLENVVPACRSCNANKHAKTLVEYAQLTFALQI